MGDIFPERLEPAAGVTALDRQKDQRHSGSGTRRRPAPPAVRAEEEPDDDCNDPKHELDRLA